MKNIIILSTLALSLTACMREQHMVYHNALSNYDRTSSSTDRYGTITEQQTTSRVNTDKYGNRSAVVSSKTTENPKGMFNTRTTRQTRQVIEE